MKPFLAFIFLLLSSFAVVQAQQIVWDISCMETLIANHQVQYSSFRQIKNNEAEVAACQKSIRNKMVQIQAIQDKLYNSLKDVSAIVRSGKDVIYARDIVNQIYKYQGQMVTYAKQDPKLLAVAVKTESALIDRTFDMYNYIYMVAIAGTDVNLMDNKQRMDFLRHIITELRKMRGLAYTVVRQMRTAQRNGILATLSPGTFKYPNNRSVLVKQVLDRYKVNKR